LDFEDLEKDVKIGSEFFAGDRLPWVPKLDGAQQIDRPEGIKKG
jgi:hypothetical protein